MEFEIFLSDGVNCKLYETWPEDVRDQAKNEISKLKNVNPDNAKIAPSPPYPKGIGHLHVFKIMYNDRYHFFSVFYVFSDALDSVLVTDVTVSPSLKTSKPIKISSEFARDVTEIPAKT